MEDIEDTDFVASEHDILISAVSKLDKTQHISEPTRNEPTNTNSEFNLIKRTSKIDINKVVKVLGDASRNLQISKKLKKTQNLDNILPKPLEKPQAERIKRATGYEQNKKKLGRWDPVVARSRTVDFVSFPLNGARTKVQPTKDFIQKLKLKSPLEKELEEIDPPAVEEEEEEEQTYPMSYEEMVEHRQNLAKIRAQESYKAAKAKRQSKIKSKKFHRILKKDRLKQELKEFEELQKKNPEEALQKLEALEKSRALERHTLRHKNTGKWARNQLIRAKYDKDTRQQIAEQLAVSRSLTHKNRDTQSSDDEAEDEQDTEDLSQDPMNPWMFQSSNKSNIDDEFNFGYKKYLKEKLGKKEDTDTDEDDENDVECDKEINLLKESVNKINEDTNEVIEYVIDAAALKKTMDELKQKSESQPRNDDDTEEEINVVKKSVNKIQKSDNKTKVLKTTEAKKAKSKGKIQKTKPVATSEWIVETINPNEEKERENAVDVIANAFDNLEEDVAKKVEEKLKMLRANIEKLENAKVIKHDVKKRNKKKDHDNLEYLKMKDMKTKIVIDEELNETNNLDAEDALKTPTKVLEAAKNVQVAAKNVQEATADIDPSKFIEVKPKYLNTALPNFDHDQDELDDEQVVPKVNIEEVFEEDDVVASFRQEKEDEINKNAPSDVDLSLPGWGSWGGKGVKATKRKRNRFIMKAPPKMPRRDENKGDVIIKEFDNPKLSSHKVTDVPFPFTSVKDYEASIRAPLGNTFISEKAHQKLIKPAVITKAGAIIEPMNEEQLLVKRNRNFDNPKVLKMLGKK